MKLHNFSAGPSILPQEVLEKAAQAVVDFNGMGLSLLEISHRSAEFEEVLAKAQSLVKELLGVPAHYEVLFLQGGASTGFYITALNYLKEGGKAAYVNTGVWADKAIKEAKLVGQVDVIASSEDKKFSYIPKGYSVPANADYLHVTSNNTIYGSQFHAFPESQIPVICDMSSDIFSRPIDASKFAMIYAGAQKNMGPAGTTLYVIDPNYLGKTGRKLPSMLDLSVQIKNGSMFNTPPVFAIYVSMLTMEWIKAKGGLSAMEKRNQDKASLLYAEIDRNSLFNGNIAKEDRSLMNVTFTLKNEAHKEAFDKSWKEAGIREIQGHRSAGGYRASIYNAMEIESVQALVNVMKEFEKKMVGVLL